VLAHSHPKSLPHPAPRRHPPNGPAATRHRQSRLNSRQRSLDSFLAKVHPDSIKIREREPLCAKLCLPPP
jgi:hypothetical protein